MGRGSGPRPLARSATSPGGEGRSGNSLLQPSRAMSAQSATSRSRKAPMVSDDPFVARALEFSDWARRNIRLIVGGGVVAALLVGGLLYWRMSRAERLERAATEFLALEQTVASGNQPLAVRDLQTYITRFEGTMYADEAQLILGRLRLDAGETAEAIAAVEPLADRIDDSPLGAQAALLMADAQQAAGQTEAAIATYLRVADESSIPFRQEEALQTAALLREQSGDLTGAAELYQRLLDMAEEGSIDRAIYEMRLAEVQAAASAQQ